MTNTTIRQANATLLLRIGRRLTVNCRDYAEASLLYCQARDESDEGASTFPTGSLSLGGKKVARISYNGRIWDGDRLLQEASA